MMAKALAASLRLVSSPDEIRANVRRFQKELAGFRNEAQTLARQTWYWVYAADSGGFGPSKFVGFAGMSFTRRRSALTGKLPGAAFDGGLTRRAVEKVLKKPYKRESALVGQLKQWGNKTFGVRVFDTVDQAKWRFVRLDGRAPVGESADEAILEAIELAQSKRGGQGFALTKEERKAIEEYAMDRATEVLEKEGYQVDDVSANSPHDLCCRQEGKIQLYAEVKGTTGLGNRVFLTAGEVRIRVSAPREGVTAVRGGVSSVEYCCQETHALLGTLPRYEGPGEVDYRDGLCFFYETGEVSLHAPEGRVVRVGNHPRSDGGLVRRLRNHYSGGKNGSVFRKFLGGALLRSDDVEDARQIPGPVAQGCRGRFGMSSLASPGSVPGILTYRSSHRGVHWICRSA